MTQTRIQILGSGSVKNSSKPQNANDSGSANHTKLNANASGSGFRNLDSGIFMRTPDSHHIDIKLAGEAAIERDGVGGGGGAAYGCLVRSKLSSLKGAQA